MDVSHPVRIFGVEPPRVVSHDRQHRRQIAAQSRLQQLVQHLRLDQIFKEDLGHFDILCPLRDQAAEASLLDRHRLAVVAERQAHRHDITIVRPRGARSRQHRGHSGCCGVTARSDPPASRIERTQHHRIDPIITNQPRPRQPPQGLFRADMGPVILELRPGAFGGRHGNHGDQEKMNDVRGKGFLAGVELMQSRNSKERVGVRQIQPVATSAARTG